MEDAATAEISRSQLWQWLKHECKLNNGQNITVELLDKIFQEELDVIKTEIGEERFNKGKFEFSLRII